MDSFNASAVVSSDMTVSDKIRALAAAGYPRADIARLLGKRYQHVRNVLEADKLNHASGAASGVAEPQRRFEGPPPAGEVEERGAGVFRLRVREDGSVVVPATVLAAFGVHPGLGGLIGQLQGETFTLESPAESQRRVAELMEPYRWRGGPLASDELIAERRAEAERDSSD